MHTRGPARLVAWLATGLLAGLGCWHAAVSPIAPLTRLELATADWRTQALLPAQGQPHPDIVIVDIDDHSLQAIGHWPWPRGRMAALVTELTARQKAAVVGLDVVFPEPDDGHWATLSSALAQQGLGDQALSARLQQSLDQDGLLAQALQGRPAVMGYYLTAQPGAQSIGPQPPALAPSPPLTGPRWTSHVNNVGPLSEASADAGFFNVVPDADSLIRQVPAVASLDGRLLPSLSLAMLRSATGHPRIEALMTAAADAHGARALTGLRVTQADGATRTLALDENQAWHVPYRGHGGRDGGGFRYISASTLLTGQLPERSLANKLVLIGSSATGMSDLRATPVHPAMPGVEIHAHVLAGLLDGTLAVRPAWAAGYEVCLMVLSLGLATWAALTLAAPWAVGAMVGLTVTMVAGNVLALTAGGLVLPLGAALALGLVLLLVLLGVNYVNAWHSRRSLMHLFNQYLPPARAREVSMLPASAQITAENRELTVLFCDLQGFSGLAEKLSPDALRDLLNLYFSRVTEVVHAHEGTVDKFIGDAVMAFWGAPLAQPDHARRAVMAALELSTAVASLNKELVRRQLPTVHYGIGMATGVVCVGDLGSRLRRSYTAVGDAVNIAARLEAMTRQAGVNLLVSEDTRQACAEALPDVAWAEVDRCQVRGRHQSVTVFTPLQAGATNRPKIDAQLRLWALALEAQRQQHTSDAATHLQALRELLDAAPHTPGPLASLAANLTAQLDTPPAPE
ncbi:MAG: adenylate/guanylate cyclase domain-containing protein [Burkholderiales bacterium PBB6]|nr:MAG: adenylate/guanylate cyclase domain-containing protein [Burkholderiales bacterium PBB6]